MRMIALHPFQGRTVFLAMSQANEEVLKPLLGGLGIECLAVEIAADVREPAFGKIDRNGTVRETLRMRIEAAARILPQAQLILASERSFGPQSLNGFLQTDLESLLLWDRETNCEIYAEHLDVAPVLTERVLSPRDDFRAFLREVDFPKNSITVHPEGSLQPIFKGLREERAVAQAMFDSFLASKGGRVVLATDLGANHHSIRRMAIREAGKKLISNLRSICPDCNFPGFATTDRAGLPCRDFAKSSQIAMPVILRCPRCSWTQQKPRPDGLLSLESYEREFLSPSFGRKP